MYGGAEHGEVVAALSGQHAGVDQAPDELGLHLDPARVRLDQDVGQQRAKLLHGQPARGRGLQLKKTSCKNVDQLIPGAY